MRLNPHLFEMNASWLLRRCSEKYGKTLTLAAIPDEEWKLLRARGMDILWIMGVWKRSPGARKKAVEIFAGSGWPEKEITGSPYAVYDYSLEPSFGAPEELREVRDRLNRFGLKLMLDFVPNHLAFDHPWTLSHPEYFISSRTGSFPRKRESGTEFFEAKPGVYLAHGRDPYFPPWTDTVQINYFSAAAREAMIGELLKIAGVCDGVRCDMAMLLIRDIFRKTWGAYAEESKPSGEFWQKAIDCIRRKRHDFIFMAEAYWNTEWQLQQMGFDFTYDKILYDRLLQGSAEDVRGHLTAEPEFQKRSARFIENHDEKRAVAAFGWPRAKAAAVVSASVPGLRFFHDGQFEGRAEYAPIQLAGAPSSSRREDAAEFYDRLLKIIDAPAFHEGNWKLLTVSPSSENNSTHANLLAWSWEKGADIHWVVVNHSDDRSQGRVKLPRNIRGAKKVSFVDELQRVKYSYSAEEINAQGIYVDLEPWEAHLMKGPVLEKEGK